ncbi:uncharacterized protein LOC112170429 [Rosa chinensis]|uniref:uncharacterized protein LOC112170429 n=1 Tax=Rosa chinensis TaxID=74649 RepID=UPI000D086DBC|nr:uncharacterized protein LOC112170429 [Rosa chinensis]
MADPLVARCIYSGKGHMIPLNQCMSYSELYEDIFRTFQFLPSDVVELQYSVPVSWCCRSRKKLRKYAIAVGFEFVFLRNDVDRIHAVCANVGTEGCDWHLRALSSSANGCLYIRELNNIHTCKGVVRTQKHKLLGSKVVKACIDADVSYNLSLKPKEIMSKFKSTYGFDISYKVALKAKHRAKEAIYGSEADSFSKLSWYKEAVLERFQFCLPMLYVDGTFGKSIYRGQILSATGRNGNQDANWTFFFKQLKSLLEPQGRVITFISDRGTGLLSAFDKVFAGNPHLFCYKHLAANLAGKYRGKDNSVLIEGVKQKFFKVAYSSTEKEYSFNLRLLRAAGGADIIDFFLAEIPVENWCRAFYTRCRYGIMANGIAESFNSWIAIERLMPVYCMLDQTRIKQMEMAGQRRDEAQRWTTELTPKMEERSIVFLVADQFFSCPHGLASIQATSSNVYDYIDKYFRIDMFKKSYSFPILPITNVDMSSSESATECILPPLAKRPPGRPRVKQFKSVGEVEKKLIRCGRCGKMSTHNKLRCTEPLVQQ